ncbi:DoxX protein [Thermostaphylospora chromogena]|uniref:DoxX protein n=1 Tax=Thermostaphylospora chromogena TaxID=35622 RepID=A0A1H1I2C9_9ACTN|nr:DoxX protein [Thermostaphylospora chromogena]
MSDVRRTLHDLASLAARAGVGGIFFAGGWDKLEAGLNATGDQFAQLGAPAPHIWAAVTVLTELIGSALLVAGVAVPACSLLLFAEALAVFIVGRGDPGLSPAGGDVSLIVALGAASLLLAVGGAGRISVDHMVVIKRREADAADDRTIDDEADDVPASLREPAAGGEDAGGAGPAEAGEPGGRAAGRADADEPAAADGTGETAERSRGRSRSTRAGRPALDDADGDDDHQPGDTLVAGRRTPRSGKSR